MHKRNRVLLYWLKLSQLRGRLIFLCSICFYGFTCDNRVHFHNTFSKKVIASDLHISLWNSDPWVSIWCANIRCDSTLCLSNLAYMLKGGLILLKEWWKKNYGGTFRGHCSFVIWNLVFCCECVVWLYSCSEREGDRVSEPVAVRKVAP